MTTTVNDMFDSWRLALGLGSVCFYFFIHTFCISPIRCQRHFRKLLTDLGDLTCSQFLSPASGPFQQVRSSMVISSLGQPPQTSLDPPIPPPLPSSPPSHDTLRPLRLIQTRQNLFGQHHRLDYQLRKHQHEMKEGRYDLRMSHFDTNWMHLWIGDSDTLENTLQIDTGLPICTRVELARSRHNKIPIGV